MVNPEIRYKVIQLYKTLLYMGKDYPKGYMYFRDRCHNAFMKNKDVKDSEQILKLVTHGQFVVKELEALYFLKKYRTMKNRYYKDEEKDADVKKFEEIVNPKRDS